MIKEGGRVRILTKEGRRIRLRRGGGKVGSGSGGRREGESGSEGGAREEGESGSEGRRDEESGFEGGEIVRI